MRLRRRVASRAMPTSLVTGGAGFLGSHLCEALLGKGHRVICLDNLETGSLANITHLRGDEFTFLHHDVSEPMRIDEPLDFVYHLAALASPIDYMRLPLHSLKTGSYGTHHALGAREVEAGAVPARVDERGLRGPRAPSAAGDLLGERQSDRPARRVRRGEALCGGADDGLSPPAGRRHVDRPDLQHLRPEDEAERRSRDPELREPGARREAAHRLRRRLADAELLLRRRPDPRA